MNSTSGTEGITEDDIAGYLANTPGFFERHAELLASVQLSSPHGARAVSLQERQMEMLRERIKNLERKIMEMIRFGQDNMAIADRLHRWTRSVMLTHDAERLAPVMLHDLQHQFMIPQAAVRVWGVLPEHAGLPCAAVVSGIRLGWLDARVEVDTHGGRLAIAWAGGADDSVFMTGPATTVYEGEISL